MRIQPVMTCLADRFRAWKRRAGLMATGLPVVLGCALDRQGRNEVAVAFEKHLASSAETATSYSWVAARTFGESKGESEPATTPAAAESLREYIVLALERNPQVKALEAAARAASERITQVTALPDPMISTRTLIEPVRTADGDNYFILGVTQQFPVPEKLDRAGRAALEELRIALHQVQETRIRVIAEVKQAYFQLYVLDKNILITQDNQKLLRGLIDVARAQVSAGRRPQDDLLRAQLEMSGLEAELIELRQRRVSAAARLNELLDRSPAVPVPTPDDFGVRSAELALDALLARAAEANPALHRVRHQIKRDEQALELARLGYWPEFTLGFEWMYMKPRDAFRPPPDPATGQAPPVSTMSEEGMDSWGIMFEFSVPIWFDKIEAGISEARHRLLASRHEYTSMQNRVSFEVADALERVVAQRTLAALFETTIIPQAQQTYEVSQVSYIAGKSDFLNVLDNWRKWIMFTIQYYRSLGELERSVADLEQAVGLSLSELGGPP